MGLETGTYVNDLNTANPTSTDPKSQGDDHLRLIKAVLKNTFAGFPGLIAATGTEAQGATVNDYVVTVSPAPAAYTANFFLAFKATHTNSGAVTIAVNALAAKTLKGVDGAAVEAGDIESGGIVVVWYDGTDFFLISANDRAARAGDTYTGTHDFSGATQVDLPADTNIGNVSAAELGALDGITGNVQDQIDDLVLGKVDEVSGTAQDLNLTGVPTAPTATAGTATTQVATTAFVVATAFSAALPGQTGNAGKFVTTDGTNAFWAEIPVDTAYITGATTIANRKNFISTLGGSFSVDLPATPTVGDTVEFIDAGPYFTVASLTVDGNGNTITTPSDTASTLVVDVSGVTFALLFTGTTWRLL